MSKISSLPGQSTSPKAFAGMLVEHGDEIEHIACVVQWKSGHTGVYWTQATARDLSWLDHVFRTDFMAAAVDHVRGRAPRQPDGSE